MNDSLLILGAGQYGCVVKEIAQAMNCFQSIDYLDDQNPIAIGKLADYTYFAEKYTCAVVAIGNPQMRLAYLEKLKGHYRLPNLIHPHSYISTSAQLGCGCVVEPMAVVHANTKVGTGCLICAGAVVNHNSELGDGCQIDCNSTVPARSVVQNHTKVGAGTVFCYGNIDG